MLRPMKVDTDGVWVAVKVGGKNYWLFNVMDSDTRFLLSAYLSPTRTTRAAATALARQRSNNPPRQLKTDGLASYRDAVPRAFPTHPVKPAVAKGIRAQINNNLGERLQGTIRDRDKTLRGPKAPETEQAYVDGLVTHYNYFRPHESLDGKRPAEAAGAEPPFDSLEDVAAMQSGYRSSEWGIIEPCPTMAESAATAKRNGLHRSCRIRRIAAISNRLPGWRGCYWRGRRSI